MATDIFTGRPTRVTGIQVPARVAAALDRFAQLIPVGALNNGERAAVRGQPAYASMRPALDEPTPVLLGRLTVALDQITAALEEDTEHRPDRMAVVGVVTDWARIGMPGRLTQKLLHTLYESYWRHLTNAGPTTAVSKSGFTRALRWATKATSPHRPWLVDEVTGGHLRPYPLLGVLADDPEHGWAVSTAIWRHASKVLTGADRLQVALGAYERADFPNTRRLLGNLDPGDVPDDDRDILIKVFFDIAIQLGILEMTAGGSGRGPPLVDPGGRHRPSRRGTQSHARPRQHGENSGGSGHGPGLEYEQGIWSRPANG